MARRQIPAPNAERYELVRQLVQHRVSNRPYAGIPFSNLQQIKGDYPLALLKRTSEFAMLQVAEQFLELVPSCHNHSSAVQRLNRNQSEHFALSGVSLLRMAPPYTFPRYVRHYLKSTHSDRLSHDLIVDGLRLIAEFYER